MNVEKGRYWDKRWSLVDCCTRPDRLNIPLRTRKPTIFAVRNDLFHEAVPASFIDDAYEVMAACPHHTFLVLTKRAQNIVPKLYDITVVCPIRELGGGDYLPNVWHGLTICNQPELDAKMGDFLKVPGKKWMSIEPMLGEIDIKPYLSKPMYYCSVCGKEKFRDYCKKCGTYDNTATNKLAGIDGVVLGGETGPGPRLMHPDWVRNVRNDCAAAGVPFFFSQWGSYTGIRATGYDFHNEVLNPAGHNRTKSNGGRLLDGRTHDDLAWGKKEGI